MTGLNIVLVIAIILFARLGMRLLWRYHWKDKKEVDKKDGRRE